MPPTLKSRLKRQVRDFLERKGFVLLNRHEHRRLLMRDNMAGLFQRALASNSAPDERAASFLSFVSGFKDITQSQLFQDLFALHSLGSPGGGFFVEVGVGDGIAHSNTQLLESAFHWKGLLVEPNIRQWEHIERNRRARLAKCAASDAEGTIIFQRADVHELSYIGEQAPSDALQRRIVETVSVPKRPLNDILAEGQVPVGFEYLSIDVEGHEVEVLSGFDVERWQPKVVTIEVNEDLARAERVQAMFGPRYRLVLQGLSGCDLWLVRA